MVTSLQYAYHKAGTLAGIIYRSFNRHSIIGSTIFSLLNSDIFLSTIRDLCHGGYWQRLKQTPRTGWRNIGISNPESVADHSIKLAGLVLKYGQNRGLNLPKAIAMALIHDYPETLTGDLPPGTIGVNDKRAGEIAAMREMSVQLPYGQRYLALFLEYLKHQSPEARFIYQLDKLELVMTALKYEQKYPDKRAQFNQFWDNTQDKIIDPQLAALFRQLRQQRPN